MRRLLSMLIVIAGSSSVALAVQDPPPGRPGNNDRPAAGPERLRRARPERPPARPPDWSKLPEEEREAIQGFLNEHFPRMGVELDRLKESSPQRYERRMNRVALEMRRLMDVSERDPRRATAMIRERQVNFQLQELARSYHQAGDEEERTRIRRSVREMAGREFDNRLQRRQMEVRDLETKLAELKTRLQESESVRDEMVERRTRELLDPQMKRGRMSDDMDEFEAEPRSRDGEDRRERARTGPRDPRPEPRSKELRPELDDRRRPDDAP